MPVLIFGDNQRPYTMHALALTQERQREVFLQTQAALTGKVSADKVQEGNIRAFFELTASARTMELKLNASDGNSVISELEKLLPVNRVARVYGLSIGICQVPVVSGTKNFGNAVFTNDPTNAIFSAGEITALKALFNGFSKFKTNQFDRWDALATSRFNIVSADASTNSPKHITLQGAYTVVGGEDNVITLSIPSTGDITLIGGLADGSKKNYLFVDFTAVLVTSSGDQKDNVAAALMR